MSNDLSKKGDINNILDSGADVSSLGSSESEVEPNKTHPINEKTEKNLFFKEKTPEISSYVLNNKESNGVSSDESDPNLLDNFYHSKKPNDSNETTPKIQKTKSNGAESTSPQIIQAKQQLAKLMKQLETKSAQKSEELEKVNEQLLTHSAELHKYNQEIEAKLAELRRAQNQLRKFVSSSSESTPMNSPSGSQASMSDFRKNSTILSPMSVKNRADDSERDTEHIPLSNNVQTRDISIIESPQKDAYSSTKEGALKSPNVVQLNNQLDQANKQLEKLQNQLNQFFIIFGSNDENNTEKTDDDFSKIIEKAKKDKELADSVKSTYPGITSGDVQTRSVELEPGLLQLEKLQNLLHQFFDIFNPDVDQNLKDSLTDEDYEKLLNQARTIKDFTKSIEELLPPQEDSISLSSSPSNNSDDIISQIKNLKAKSDQLDEVLNQLRNLNQQLDSKTNELENTQNKLRSVNQQLDSKSANLNELNKKLEEVYKIIEAIEGQQIDSENMTDERLSDILDKVKSENQKGKTDKDSLQSRLKKISEIFNKPENLNDEEFLQLVDLARKSKELSDAIQSALPEDSSNSAEVQEKIRDLEAKSAELNKVREQFISLVNAIEGSSEDNGNFDEISNEKLSDIIKKAKRDKEISNSLQSSSKSEDQEITDEIQEKLRDLEAKSDELDRVKKQFNTLVHVIEGNDENAVDDLSSDKISEIIEKAKKDKEISDFVQSSFSDPSSLQKGDENEFCTKHLDTLKKRSEQLDEVTNQLASKNAELEKLHQKINNLVRILDDNNEFGQNEQYDDDAINRIIERAKESKLILQNNEDVQLDFDDQINTQKYENQPNYPIQKQLRQFLQIYEDEYGDNSDNLNQKSFEDIIDIAKKDKELADAVRTALPNHSSCGEEVQTTINILKLRSEELDDRIPKSEASQLRKRVDFLANTVACLSLPKGTFFDTMESGQNFDQDDY